MAVAEARKHTETPKDAWMTLVKAAAELGESRLSIATRCIAGELVGKHEAGRTLVTRESVMALKEQKRSERPKAAKS